MPEKRFVILEHHHQGVHYDCMFQVGGALRTWKLAQPPDAVSPLNAELSFDHRLVYLDYEGPVSGGRGKVVRWDAGIYEGDAGTNSPIRLRLYGARLAGQLELVRSADAMWRWEFRRAEAE